MAADNSGNIYITGAYSQRVSQVNAAGMISTIAGGNGAGFSGDGGPGVKAQLNNPTADAVDRSGKVYFADQWNYRIRRIASGAVSRGSTGHRQCGKRREFRKWDRVCVS